MVIIEQGRADHLHLEKDMTGLAFQNGKISTKIYENSNMSFEKKKEAFVKPAIRAATTPLKVSELFLQNFGIKIGAGQIINDVIDNIKEN